MRSRAISPLSTYATFNSFLFRNTDTSTPASAAQGTAGWRVSAADGMAARAYHGAHERAGSTGGGRADGMGGPRSAAGVVALRRDGIRLPGVARARAAAHRRAGGAPRRGPAARARRSRDRAALSVLLRAAGLRARGRL